MKVKLICLFGIFFLGLSKSNSQSPFAEWRILGNANTNDPAAPSTYGSSNIGGTEHFVGTTDAQDLVLGANDKERFRIKQSSGYVGIGTSTPSGILDIRPLVGCNVYFHAVSDAYPRMYMGGTSTTVAGLFMRITTGASYYMGADTDTGGYYFRGKGYSDIGSGRMTISSSNGGTCLGCVGINTTVPKEKLHVTGNAKFDYNSYNYVKIVPLAGQVILAGSAGGFSPAIGFSDDNDVSTAVDGVIRYTDADGMSFQTGGSSTASFRIKTDGRVIVGNPADMNTTLAPYMLFVETGIITERLKVALRTSGDWSDKVFAPDYELLSLDSVQEYTKNNCHLPGMPSADDLVKEGIDVATMDALLLKQIEELWLQLFLLKKENDELRKKTDK